MSAIHANILIAIVTAALSWFFNRLTIIAEIKKAKQERINESRAALYAECYGILERNIADNNCIFRQEYIDELIKIKPKMKLMSSNNVLQAYKLYFEWVIEKYKGYIAYCQEQDPTNNIYTTTTSDGTEYEIPAFSDVDIEYYNMLIQKYIVDRKIESRTVKSKIQSVLDAMRNDLGNDTYKEVDVTN